MRRLCLICLILALGIADASAGARLLLVDGQTLSGRSLERKDALYLLELEDGEVVTLPVMLVRELQLTGDDDPDATGLRPAAPRTLVGPERGAELRTTAEQLRVFGGNASNFLGGAVEPWRPASDLDLSPERNNFNPTRWIRAPIDSEWHPRSAFRSSSDVTEFNPARWYRSPFGRDWWPTEGFGWNKAKFEPILPLGR